jgi:hypothetical protein
MWNVEHFDSYNNILKFQLYIYYSKMMIPTKSNSARSRQQQARTNAIERPIASRRLSHGF